jgi:hypothetical protein
MEQIIQNTMERILLYSFDVILLLRGVCLARQKATLQQHGDLLSERSQGSTGSTVEPGSKKMQQ